MAISRLYSYLHEQLLSVVAAEIAVGTVSRLVYLVVLRQVLIAGGQKVASVALEPLQVEAITVVPEILGVAAGVIAAFAPAKQIQ